MKVRILMWLVVQNKLLTVDNLSKRNIRVIGIYVFCAIDIENMCSIFLFIALQLVLFRSLVKKKGFSINGMPGSLRSWWTS